MPKKKTEKTGGGSASLGDIKVSEKPAEPLLPGDDVPGGGVYGDDVPGGGVPGGEILTGEPTAEQLEVNKAIIETACIATSRILVAVTNIPEIAFDEAEVEQLKNLWSPFVPNIPPVAGAVIGTAVIVGGKVAMYMIKRKEVKKVTVGQKPPSASEPREIPQEKT